MKDINFHLPNEGLEDLESFALVFLCTYKHGLLFLHIWSTASGQLCSMTLLWCGRNKIGPNHENNPVVHYMLDRFGWLII